MEEITPELLRLKLLEIENMSKNLISWLKLQWNWEVIAQATLALRHIEDARMRFWKVIQYTWDWISIYEK